MFTQPSKDVCLDSIGLMEKRIKDGGQIYYQPQDIKLQVPLTQELLKAIQPDSVFEPVPKPGSNDWLANHKEDGQTFKQFVSSNPNIPDKTHSTIYILPLTFVENPVPSDVLDKLVHFASMFFALPVKILQAESFTQLIEHRVNQFTGKEQLHAGQILKKLSILLPNDAFSLSAITLCDLYPSDSWNFVFGLARKSDRVSVYSLARYMPGFPEESIASTAEMTSKEKAALLKRSCLLMCHEICHMFGLQHCIYFHCLMNGSNHFEENDKKPLHLCPVCLRKLHHCCQFSVVNRYEQLANFCLLTGMKQESKWFEKRLAQLK